MASHIKHLNSFILSPKRVIFLLISGFIFTVFITIQVQTGVEAATGINETINFQGKVVNKDGTNVADGQYSFVFRLYDVDSGGSHLWTETQNVQVTAGVFRVALGSVTPITGVDFNTDNIYLGINFNSDGEMTPRVRFASVPYAFNAQKVAGLTVTDTTGTLTIQNGDTIEFGGEFTTDNDISFTTSGATTLTLPQTGTLATLAGAENLSNKTFTSSVTISGVTIDLTTGVNESLTVTPNGTGNVLINPSAGGQAALIVNKTGLGDIFSASSAGITKFVIKDDGTASSSAGFTIDGLGSLQSTKNQTLTVGGGSTGDLVIGRTSQRVYFPGFTSCSALETDSNGILGCGTDDLGGVGGSGNFWQINSGVLAPGNQTLDLAFGGTTTSSAKFALSHSGTLPTAKVNGVTSFAAFSVNNSGVGDILTASSGGTTQFTISNSGNVGIGSITPDAFKLEVAGNIGPSNGGTSSTVTRAQDEINAEAEYVSMAVGFDGLPIIAYQDDVAGQQDLTVYKCSNIGCTSGTETEVDATTVNMGTYPSIAIPPDGLPVIAYHDETGGDLEFVKCGNTSCSAGNIITTLDTHNTDVGEDAAVAIGVDGFPIIAYQDTTGADLEVIKCSNATCSSNSRTTVISANAGWYNSIAIGPDTFPVISYHNPTSGALDVTKCNDIACSGSNETTNTVNSTAAVMGLSSTVAIGGDGLPVIAYRDASNDDLEFTKCGNAACSSGNITTTLNSADAAGSGTSMTIAPDGMPVIVYGISGSTVRILKCSNPACSNNTTDIDTTISTADITRGSSIAIAPDGLPIVVWNENGNADIEFIRCADPTCSQSSAAVSTGGLTLGANVSVPRSGGSAFQNLSVFNISSPTTWQPLSLQVGGIDRLALTPGGVATSSADFVLYGGARSISTTNSETLTIGGGTSGGLILGRSGVNINFGSSTFSSCSALETVNGILGCGTDDLGGVGGSGNFWQINSGVLAPGNQTLDLAFGGTTTSSAKFALSHSGTLPTALVNGSTANAAFVVNNSGVGDIFSASSSGTTKLVINSSGYIGIGQNIPTRPLEISIDQAASTVISVKNGSSANSALSQLFLEESTASQQFARLAYINSGNSNSAITSVPNSLLLGVGSAATNGINIANFGANPIKFTTGGTAFSFERMRISGTGEVGIGTTSPTARLHVTGIYGNNAAMILNQANAISDIFAASSSGTTKFVIKNDGIASSSAGFTVDGVGSIQSTNNQTLYLGGGTTGEIVFGKASQRVQLPGFTNCSALETNSSGFLGCGSDDAGSGGGGNFWQYNTSTGIVANGNLTTDLLLGGVSTASAKFAFVNMAGGNPTFQILSGNGLQSMSFYHDGTNGYITSTTGTINIGNGAGSVFIEAPLINDTTSNNGSVFVSDKLLVQNSESAGNALVVFDNTGLGDILTASASGVSKFTLKNDGTASSSAGFTIDGAGLVQSTRNQTLTIGGGSTGHLIIGRVSQTTLLPGFENCTLKTTTGGLLSCGTDNAGGGGANFWQYDTSTGIVANGNLTTDFLLGGTSTASAKFAVLNVAGGTPTASVSAGTSGALYVTADGTIATTARQRLRLGGTTTAGDVSIAGGRISDNGIGIGSVFIEGGFGSFGGGGTGGNVTIAGGTAGPADGFGGNVIITGGSGNTAGSISIGTSNTAGLTLASSTISTTINGKLGINTSTLFSTLDIRRNSVNGGTISIASVSGATSFAGMIVDNSWSGDLFTASTSGLTRFTITNNGTASTSAGFVVSGLGGIQGTRNQTLAIGGNTTGNVVIRQGNTPGLTFMTNGKVGVGTSTPNATLDVRAQNGTLPVASIAGATSFAGLIVDNTIGDLFTASSSGLTRFTIKQSGVVQIGSSTNGLTFDYLNGGPTYTGTARPTKTIVLSPEYAGAILTASGSATTLGSLTSDASNSATLAADKFKTYYEWSSTETSLHNYTVALRVTLPSDFSSWPTSGNALTINFNTGDTSTTANGLDVHIYNPADDSTGRPVYFSTNNVSGTDKTWTTIGLNGGQLDNNASPDWDAPGETVTIYLRMKASGTHNYTQIGDIEIDYMAKF